MLYGASCSSMYVNEVNKISQAHFNVMQFSTALQFVGHDVLFIWPTLMIDGVIPISYRR